MNVDVLLSSNEMVKDRRIPLLSFTGSNAVSCVVSNLFIYFEDKSIASDVSIGAGADTGMY